MSVGMTRQRGGQEVRFYRRKWTMGRSVIRVDQWHGGANVCCGRGGRRLKWRDEGTVVGDDVGCEEGAKGADFGGGFFCGDGVGRGKWGGGGWDGGGPNAFG
jgi:hypothetical protein